MPFSLYAIVFFVVVSFSSCFGKFSIFLEGFSYGGKSFSRIFPASSSNNNKQKKRNKQKQPLPHYLSLPRPPVAEEKNEGKGGP